MKQSSLKKYTFTFNPEEFSKKTEDLSQRLDHYLYEKLNIQLKPGSVTKTLIRKCIIAGAVYLNGKRVKIASKPLRVGARVDIYLDMKKLQDHKDSIHQTFEVLDSHILYRDEYILAVHKPSGLPTQPTLDNARENLFEAVKKYLTKNSKGPIYCGLHHRLDRDTSGVVLFTLKKEINSFFSDIFQGKKIHKTYHALCYSNQKSPLNIPQSWEVKNFLGEKPKSGKRKLYTSVRSGGKVAETDFQLIQKFKNFYWIEARPLTGRTHQIRVHLSEFGLPIFGEFVYAQKDREPMKAPRLLLHAKSIEFMDYKDQTKTIKIEAPLPKDFCEFKEKLGF